MIINFEKMLSDVCLSQDTDKNMVSHVIIDSECNIVLIENLSTSKYTFFVRRKAGLHKPYTYCFGLISNGSIWNTENASCKQFVEKPHREGVFGLFLKQKKAHRYSSRNPSSFPAV